MLILGASGLLGSRLMLRSSDRFETVGTYNPAVDGKECSGLHSLDIGSKDEVERLFEKARPDQVILTAAVTNLDVCERNPELAQKINVDGPEHVAKCCKKIGAKLLFLSSAYVFDGEKKGKYVEGDLPNPISVYGRTKLAGEQAISSILSDFIIARSAVMYGPIPTNGKNTFIATVMNRLRARQTVGLFDDQWVSPTFCDDLAKALLDLSDSNHTGILNTSGPDCMTRLKCGIIVADIFGLDRSLISPVPMSSLSLPARRPVNACLDVSKVEKVLKRGMTTFEEGIRVMKELEESRKP